MGSPTIRLKLIGYLYMLLSVCSFSFMVILTKYLNLISTVSPEEITFFRFFISFTVIVFVKFIFKKPTKTNNLRYLIERGVSNFLAVLFLFVAISMISATKANLYNMTYPIFVALIAHFSINEKLTKTSLLSVIIGFIGVLFVIKPNEFQNLHVGDVIGLLSGITAGYAVVSLKKASLSDAPFTILFYHMGIGFVLSCLLTLHSFVIPSTRIAFLLIINAILSLLGQYFLTYAYAYVTAVEGAVIASARIFFVAFLGVLLFNEYVSMSLIIGSLLIIASIIIINPGLHISKIKKLPSIF
ncbi:MAG: hypothetical protein A2X42_05250 [Candidatus Margulisbacteria bacterium GWF2_38_17]|nr:MAG: hypothetical protein A2X43_00425 [Candidatus Margulisbacteria bacterium GWD2_39_127]OGI04307.1 MAG: hypothetical protein A2X42_05250 [Candidatus Margulisbacteria bacterium GWF2_38_17]OGI11788.1 MAG: hypothetical protein A2X41_11000 [Candidatus Margulisbacteria bacterium GWE2_39_32]